jgi:hypothetical protein
MNAGGPFTRYSLAGWIFVVVTLASLAFSENQDPWRRVIASITAGGSNSAPSILAAVLGVIAGLSAPPAIGYVLTRAAAAGDDVRRFFTEDWDEAANRHALLYAKASQGLIDWQEERSTLTNASYSCILAGFAAILFAGFVLRAWAVWVVVIVVIFGVQLFLDAIFTHAQREAALNCWHTDQDHPSTPNGDS